MPTITSPIRVYIPQLDGLHWSDWASLFIAFVAIGSLAVAVFQVRDAKRSNERNYQLSKAQLDQMKVDNLRQHEIAILQIKRENRIRIYAPLLAFLRAWITEFGADISLIVFGPKTGSKSSHELNLEKLKESVTSYEFRAELDLLGDPAISAAMNKWISDLYLAYDQLEELRDLQRESSEAEQSDRGAHVERLARYQQELKEAERHLRRDLESLKNLILAEFQ